ncbi:MAG: winged helix-turn-helix domain-containing protein [Candidatus Bathycorpusculaceae bacterium]
MRKSKLESYEEILETLIKKPLALERIAYEISMECGVLKRRIEFLIKNDLVEERNSGRKTLYAITERGMAVFKTLNFQKYLEKVVNTIRIMDEAAHIIPKISEAQQRKAEENENY